MPYDNPFLVSISLGMDWNGFPGRIFGGTTLKLSEKRGIELRKAVVKGVRKSTEMRKKRNREPGGTRMKQNSLLAL